VESTGPPGWCLWSDPQAYTTMTYTILKGTLKLLVLSLIYLTNCALQCTDTMSHGGILSNLLLCVGRPCRRYAANGFPPG